MCNVSLTARGLHVLVNELRFLSNNFVLWPTNYAFLQRRRTMKRRRMAMSLGAVTLLIGGFVGTTL
jgi:hypothetical protein